MDAKPAARILVVDDDPGVLRAVERILADRADVRTASRPADACAIAPAFLPDVAICDVRMPGMDGFELLGRLHDLAPGVDIILMTGSMTEPDALLLRALREEVYFFILKPFSREVLQALVDRCLENRRLRSVERAHLGRLERELAAASAFQRAMLPDEEARIAGVRISARFRPCDELGGDLVDFCPAPDGSPAFLLADVSGHGVPAALLTGAVKATFRGGVARGLEPAAIVREIRRTLGDFGGERFVTCFLGQISRERRLTYVNAGHPLPMLLADAVPPARLDTTAPLVSASFPAEMFEQTSLTLPPRCRILAFTDGLADTLGCGLGEAALLLADLAGLAAEPSAGLARLMECLPAAAEPDRIADDVTILVLDLPA